MRWVTHILNSRFIISSLQPTSLNAYVHLPALFCLSTGALWFNFAVPNFSPLHLQRGGEGDFTQVYWWWECAKTFFKLKLVLFWAGNFVVETFLGWDVFGNNFFVEEGEDYSKWKPGLSFLCQTIIVSVLFFESIGLFWVAFWASGLL